MYANTQKSFLAWVGIVAAISLAMPAKAAVTLGLTSSGTTATSTSVSVGQTFNVDLRLTSTAETLTGVDYYFHIDGAAAGHVKLTNRDITASPFTDPVKLNIGDNAGNPGVLDPSVSILNSQSALDLGATISNVNSALSVGTYLLGTYSLTVDSSTPIGTYTLSTTSIPGSGAVTQAPTFNEQSFDQQAALSLTVTPATLAPEPAGAMVLLGMLGMALRRRLR